MSRRRALITGITGQDGSYLAELLLAGGYDVAGLVSPAEFESQGAAFSRIAGIREQVELLPASLGDASAVNRCIASVQPDECYHLAAKSTVSYDPADEAATLDANIAGTHVLLAAHRQSAPGCRLFFAASSEIFGNDGGMVDEQTRMEPRSFYGVTKIAGLLMTRVYRQNYGMHASAGILFNHESPRRGPEFVTRKITVAVARIAAGERIKLSLGNLESRRDWGHARDYVQAMWRMLQQPAPGDYVIATGVTRSVRDFCDVAFRVAGLRYEDHVVIDPALFRPVETAALAGDATRARQVLGWEPQNSFEDLVREMVEYDCRALGVELSRSQHH